MEKRLIIVVLIISVLYLPSATGAQLDRYHYGIIRVAFMNGYVKAVDTDINMIEKLKNNRELLQKQLNIKVSRYLEKVEKMNNKSVPENERKRSLNRIRKPSGSW